MDVIKKLILKDLQLNKKRTIVTIIGIILSTALICAVAGMVTSVQKTLVEASKIDDGNYHVTLYNVPKDELKYIQNNRNIEKSYLSEELGYSYLKESKNEYKPYLNIVAMEDFQNSGVNLVSGRLPENSNEIVISESILNNGKVKYDIGQKLALDIGKRISNGYELNQRDPYNEENPERLEKQFTKEYTIVGIIERINKKVEPHTAPGYTVITKLEGVDKKANISILYKNKFKYQEYTEEINEMKQSDSSTKEEDIIRVSGMRDKYCSQKYEVEVNTSLLSYEGANLSDNTMTTLCGLAGIVIAIIIVSSVFVIRNSFAISITEKMKQYGMLSSVGATSKQIKKSVLFEGFVLGFIAIPLGIISGVVAVIVLLCLMNFILEDYLNGIKFLYSIPIIPILISILLSAITIYLSCRASARRASKVPPIEAIRSNQDIKIKSKKMRCPKYISKLFGIGGEISYKNLKRNKKKYRTTIISIIVSVVIFISLSTFIEYGFKMSNVYYTELSYNISMYCNQDEEDFFKKVSKLDNIEKYSIQTEELIEINDKENKYLTDFSKNRIGLEYNENKLTIEMISVDEQEYARYIKELSGDAKKYEKGAILINEGRVYYDGKPETGEIYNIKAGDSLNVTTVEDKKNLNIDIVSVTNKKPMGLETTYSDAGFLIINNNFLKDSISNKVSRMYINSTDAIKLEDDISKLMETENISKSNIGINNIEEAQKAQNSMILVISIFLYGFITVITLIGITNIFNTISTNMNLRKKEFAMLKSVGMTSKEFKRMIRLENIFYGIKALIIGIPMGIGVSYLIYKAFLNSLEIKYMLPINAIVIATVFVFLVIGIIMRFAVKKINKQNIIETIRNDNI